MASRSPEPMKAILNDEKPSPDWPSMNSVSAPVDLHRSANGPNPTREDAVPPQEEALEAQAGVTSNVSMGSTFTGTPRKPVSSALALDTQLKKATLQKLEVAMTKVQ